LRPAKVPQKRFDALIFSGRDEQHDGKAPGELLLLSSASLPGASSAAAARGRPRSAHLAGLGAFSPSLHFSHHFLLILADTVWKRNRTDVEFLTA
jgi:hypothetical protein